MRHDTRTTAARGCADGAARLVETTNAGAHAWQLPSGTLVVGTAGEGRALVMMSGRDEVNEVDDAPWDVTTVELCADTPLDLFLGRHGVPLRDREPWSELPGLAAAIEQAQTSLARDVDTLIEIGIASRAGCNLPSSLQGFRPVEMGTGIQQLVSEEHELFLLNYRPDAPAPGPSAAGQWAQACEALVSERLRDLVRAAPVEGEISELGPMVDDDLTVADHVRGLAWLALLGKARDDLADVMSSCTSLDPCPGRRLAQVFLARHVPVSLDVVI